MDATGGWRIEAIRHEDSAHDLHPRDLGLRGLGLEGRGPCRRLADRIDRSEAIPVRERTGCMHVEESPGRVVRPGDNVVDADEIDEGPRLRRAGLDVVV